MKRVLADFKNPDRAVDIPRAAVTEGVVSEGAFLAIKNCTIQIRPDVIKSPEQDDDSESSDGSHSPATYSLTPTCTYTYSHTPHTHYPTHFIALVSPDHLRSSPYFPCEQPYINCLVGGGVMLEILTIVKTPSWSMRAG